MASISFVNSNGALEKRFKQLTKETVVNKSKPPETTKLPKKPSSKISSELFSCEAIQRDIRKTFLRSVDAPSNAPSASSSIDRLSFYFRLGSDKANETQDNYGQLLKDSLSKLSRSALDTINLEPASTRPTIRKIPMTHFCTCSSYIGEWNQLGIAGEGVYIYPHGVIYDGQFNDNGLFHGKGSLIYPNGELLEGNWDNGKFVQNYGGFSLDQTDQSFSDATFDYYANRLPDRRFAYEVNRGLGVPGKEYLTNQQPTPDLPENCYDLIYGLYCPNDHNAIYHKSASGKTGDYYMDSQDEDCEVTAWWASFKNTVTVNNRTMLEIPSDEKTEWIKKYCRVNPEQPVGYNPNLYEVFTAGTKEELAEIEQSGIRSTYFKDTCPETVQLGKPAPKGLVSFVQKVIKDKRKRTAEGGGQRVSRVMKKKSLMKKCGNIKTPDNISIIVDKDLVLIYSPGTTIRGKSFLTAFDHGIKEYVFVSKEHSERVTPMSSFHTLDKFLNGTCEYNTDENEGEKQISEDKSKANQAIEDGSKEDKDSEIKNNQNQVAKNESRENKVAKNESRENKVAKNESHENKVAKTESHENKVAKNEFHENKVAKNESHENKVAKRESDKNKVARNKANKTKVAKNYSKRNKLIEPEIESTKDELFNFEQGVKQTNSEPLVLPKGKESENNLDGLVIFSEKRLSISSKKNTTFELP